LYCLRHTLHVVVLAAAVTLLNILTVIASLTGRNAHVDQLQIRYVGSAGAEFL
jgi:hypothetical protein